MTTRDNIADIYPLAPLQRGLLFHSLYAPEAAQYFEQLTCRLTGAVNVEQFAAAWQVMADRHAILRTAFVSQSAAEPVQVVMKRVSVPVTQLDWSDRQAGEQGRLLDEFLAADEAQGFALHRPPLVRVTLIRLGERDWRLVWSHHHLLLDGWSLPRFLDELFAVYRAGCQGRAPSLAPVRPYSDHIAWLGRQDRAAAEAFWRAELGDLGEATPLSMDRVASAASRGAIAPVARVSTKTVTIDAERTESLRAFAQGCAVTLNTVVQAAWAIVLGRHARSDDVVFGVTVSGRPADLPGAEAMIGLFINTLPLRLRIDPDRPVGDWLADIQRRQSEAQQFGYASLTDIQEWSGVPRGQPLFRSLYAFENFPMGEALGALPGDLRVTEARLTEKTNYPLTLVVVPGQGLNFKLIHDVELVSDRAASGLLAQLCHVLVQLDETPSALPREISLMPTPSSRGAARFSGTGPTAHASSLRAAFAAAVHRFADRIAITDTTRAWTYRELDTRVRAIARSLRARGAGPDVMIGVLADRSAELIAGMLGVVTAGAAYVPLDPDHPAERLRFMAADSGCRVVLASNDAAARAGQLPCPMLDLEDAARPVDNAANVDEVTAVDPVDPRNRAAYVIYTSGTTGQPKGVVVTQNNLLRLFSATHHWFGFDHTDVWTFFHSFAFDFSVWELWGALLHGGRVVVVPHGLSRDPDAFYELLGREGVTVLNQTPSAFGQLMAAEERRTSPLPLDLRVVVFGGEALDPGLLAPWLARHGEVPRLVNMYGITETTVHVTYRPITAIDIDSSRGSLIGQPIPDLDIRLLDSFGHPVPDGMPGEICVAGAGVSKGYLNRPELTAERFVPDPLALEPLALEPLAPDPLAPGPQPRLYRSGDLARRLPDGDLEYLGRIDRQVKIRGFRIELREIEHALVTHPAVADALVRLHQDDEGECIAAYLVRRPGWPEPTAGELGEHLRQTLPGYMVPDLYVALDAFPLTLQGKLDRNALPDPRVARIAASREQTRPETPEQSELVEIWQRVLGVPRVGIDDDYFALGGDSIRAIRVIALARKAGISITLQDLFGEPTPRRLAAVSTQQTDIPAAEPAPPPADQPFALISAADRAGLPDGVVDAFPLSRLQAGMLFHGDDSGDQMLYHDVFAFRLRLPFDEDAWQDSLRSLQAQHPVLRTSFHFDGFAEPLQLVHRDVPLPVHSCDLRGLDPDEQAARVDALFDDERRARYDWTRPGLWRARIARLGDDVCELILACHHAILDGWSLAVMVSELADHYLHRLGMRAAPPTVHDGDPFREFVALERASEEAPRSREYWDAILSDAPLTRVPRWPGGQRGGRVTVDRSLPAEVVAALRGHASAARIPLRNLLLAVHARALQLVTGSTDLVTGVVLNGRPETDAGARGLGLFLNTAPLRVRLAGDASWLELARTVHDAERAMMPHRRVPMVTLRRRQGGRELFTTSFNYVHFHIYESVLRRDDVELQHTRSEESIDIPLSVTFSIDAGSGELRLGLSVDTREIAPDQAEAIAERYLGCIHSLAHDPAAPALAAGSAPGQLATASVHGERREHPFRPVHAAVLERARQTPEAVAVELGEQTWSFSELADASARVACWLTRAGLDPGQPVVLCYERSFALVAAMLGVLEAGGAYVPVDPDCPPRRIDEILAQLGEQTPVVAGAAQAAILPAKARALIVDQPMNDPALAIDVEPSQRVERAERTDPARPAYVLFTSGSTGVPKGVVVPHGALAHHMAWFLTRFPLSDSDVILQKTPYTFDASVWEFWAALMSGARLRLAAAGSHGDPGLLAGEVTRGRVTVLQVVPSVLDVLLDEPAMPDATSLRYLFCGGEALKQATAARARAAWKVSVINLYGPTEATIQCAYAEIDGSDVDSPDMAPLGTPIHGVTLSVRDEELRVVAVDTPGELCVEGPCLAHGYWNDRALTAVRFVADPGASGRTVLRTGDGVRILPDGTLQFLGRLDDQLKVRGMRVEPGEIEARLIASREVAQAVVAARPGRPGQARLIAWVELADEPQSPGQDESRLDALRAALAEQVPDHMVPATWMLVPTWPRLPSGKIDRRALPDPVTTTDEASVVPPRPGAETELAAIWCQVLAVEQVSADDDFFALGGDSILCMQVVARARARGLTFRVRDVFANPVLRQLAAVAGRRTPVTANRVSRAPVEVPLVPMQAWFTGLPLPNPRHWNQAVLLALPATYDATHTERAVRAVIARRDAFGTRLVRRDGQWSQVIGHPATEPVFRLVDLSAMANEDQLGALRDHAATLQSDLDPERGRVFCAAYYDLGPARQARLLLVCHHVIIDGLSWRLLLQDLALALCDTPLPPAGRFAECALRLVECATEAEARDELPFWCEQLHDLPQLPLDRPEGLVANREGAAEAVEVAASNAITSRRVDDAAAALRATPHELLLAAFAHGLAIWAGVGRIAFMLEGHGRDRLADVADAVDAVGWFTAIYPVAVDIPDTAPIACLKAIKAAVRAVPRDGSGYGLLRYSAGDPGLAGRPEPIVGVNYLGRIDGSFDDAPFSLASEDVGPSVDPAAPRPRVLDLVIHMASGQVRAAFQFSPDVHDRATVQRLAELFSAALDQLCAASNPRAALCPTDFPLARIDEAELAELLPDQGELVDLLPLGSVQQGMLYHALREPEGGVYVQQVVAELAGEPERDRMERAWRAVLAAHPMLRASFVTGRDRPLQRIHDHVDLPIEIVDLSPFDEPARQARFDEFLASDRQRGFALARPPLMRLTLVRGRSWRLVWTHHHLLLDGWSLPMVFRDFLTAYQNPDAPTPVAGTTAYAGFLRWLESRDRAVEQAFWTAFLRDFPGATAPRGAIVPDGAAVESREERVVLAAPLGRALEDAARRWKVTVAVLLQAAWALVLGRHGRSRDVVFGLTVSGRPDDVAGAADAVGTYINTLPLRVGLPADLPIGDWLTEIRAAMAGVLAHQTSALVDVAGWASVTRGSDLFEAILVHENYPMDSVVRADDALAISRVTTRESNHYPLSLYILPDPATGATTLSLYHQQPRYDRACARVLLRGVERVLEQLVERDAGCVGDLVLTDTEDAAHATAWNATECPFELALPVHERFAAQAAATPDALAVIAGGDELTYRELAARSQHLATRLRQSGVAIETRVGVCLSRSTDMVAALLAILEAGGCYVPLDPGFPDHRLAIMLDDADPAWVITEPDFALRLRELGARTLSFAAGPSEPGPARPSIPRPVVAPESLAYAIFTSGSTGRPKAVMIPHRALVNTLDSFARTPGLAPTDRLVAVTTLSFDIAALELFLPLTVGATVVVAGRDVAADPHRLTELLVRSDATVMQATPATWRMLLASGWRPPRPGFRVWCGGEALTPELASGLLDLGVELWNVYGPTETTIWSTINRGESGRDAALVGRPIANTTCFVLDQDDNLAPPGVPGELVIGGVGVARGYRNRPALTAERFIPDPHGAPGSRLYRTGDLACHHADGRLDVLGRLDFQVKVRGFRVELGEIEAALEQLSEVVQAVVVAVPESDGEIRLVACMIAAADSPRPAVASLREQLASRLPAYMVPSAWRWVDAFPLTANRKIDRKALADTTHDVALVDVTPPRSPLERALVEIWKQILGIETVGVHAGFFELGGHSLAAVRVHARTRDVFRIDLPLAELLRRPTVASMAEMLESREPAPGHGAKVAAAYLRVLAMTDEEKARLRTRQRGAE